MSHTEDRYSPSRLTFFFHWVILALIALAYLAIEIRGPKGTDSRTFWMAVHFWTGSLVLPLSALRLLWLLWRNGMPGAPGHPLLRFVVRILYLALYLFIFVQPLLGILMVNAAGRPFTLAGGDISLTLIGADPIARALLHTLHEEIGNAFYVVIGLHALLAIVSRLLRRKKRAMEWIK